MVLFSFFLFFFVLCDHCSSKVRRQPAELREKKKNEINGEEREVRQVLHE